MELTRGGRQRAAGRRRQAHVCRHALKQVRGRCFSGHCINNARQCKLTSPSAVTRMFSGLTSRCTMPSECRRSRAAPVGWGVGKGVDGEGEGVGEAEGKGEGEAEGDNPEDFSAPGAVLACWMQTAAKTCNESSTRGAMPLHPGNATHTHRSIRCRTCEQLAHDCAHGGSRPLLLVHCLRPPLPQHQPRQAVLRGGIRRGGEGG